MLKYKLSVSCLTIADLSEFISQLPSNLIIPSSTIRILDISLGQGEQGSAASHEESAIFYRSIWSRLQSSFGEVSWAE